MTTPSENSLARRWLWGVVLYQLIWWTVIPRLAHIAPPLDANEMHVWSLAPQWGYYKHPPLPAWWVWVSEGLFGKSLWALFIPSSVAVALTYLAIWPVARSLLAPRQAVLALGIQSTILYYHLWSTDFNHNVVQMPMWAGTLAALFFATCHPRTRGQLRWWVLAGALLGLNALSKYTAALLVPAALIFVLWRPSARGAWGQFACNAGAALLAFLLVFGGHMLWLVQHNFLPLQYASTRMKNLAETAVFGERYASFVGALLLAHLIPLGILLASRFGHKVPFVQLFSVQRVPEENRDMWRGFWILGFGSTLLTLVLGACGVALHPMWVSAMLPWVGIAVVWLLGDSCWRLWTGRALLVVCALQLLFGTMYWFKSSPIGGQIAKRSVRGAYPGPALAAEFEQIWAQRFPSQPLRYVAGDSWEAGEVSLFAKQGTPKVLIDGNPRYAPWIDLRQLYACGALFLNPDAETLARFPEAQTQVPVVIPPTSAIFSPVTVQWALLPPHSVPVGQAPSSASACATTP